MSAPGRLVWNPASHEFRPAYTPRGEASEHAASGGSFKPACKPLHTTNQREEGDYKPHWASCYMQMRI